MIGKNILQKIENEKVLIRTEAMSCYELNKAFAQFMNLTFVLRENEFELKNTCLRKNFESWCYAFF